MIYKLSTAVSVLRKPENPDKSFSGFIKMI